MAGDALGKIKCDECGEKADIFKRGNSKKLLYVRCGCGRLDMGTTPKLQTKWRHAVDNPNSPDDWKPTPQTQSTNSAVVVKNDVKDDSETEVKNGFKKWAVGGTLVLAVALGFLGVRVKV